MVRVLSWNIDARGDGLPERIHRLADFGADIILLQEVPRRAVSDLRRAPHLAWSQHSVEHSEPTGGPGTRLGTAILGTGRVQLLASGQIPERHFIDAGLQAGLSEEEVRDRTGWLHRNLYADVEVDGMQMRVCSLHARPATGGRPGRPPLGYTRQLFHRVCAAWIVEQQGPMIVAVDANGPFVDHPDPDQWRPAMAGDATLIGPNPRHHLRDALRRWLADHPDELEAIRQARPQGPLAISYVTSGGKRPCRYDHLYVTDDLTVEDIEHQPPYAYGSDHGAIIATLTTQQP